MRLPMKTPSENSAKAPKHPPDATCSQVIPRLANGQFRAGASGNPGGRPAALAEVKQLARQHTALAIQKLAHIAEHGHSEMAQIAAANALLDRGWGRPTQPVSGDDEMPLVGIGGTAVAKLTAEERAALVASIVQGLKGVMS